MKKILVLFIPLLFFISCQDDFEDISSTNSANDIELETRSVDSLCFMTWNTALIDVPIIGDGFDLSDDFRARKICERIVNDGSDVITLQEVWNDNEIRILGECLSEAGYEVVFVNRDNIVNHILANHYITNGLPNGNGLITAVKKELIPNGSDVERESTFIEFNCESGFDSGADKGFIHTKITLEDGCEMDIFNTHLQAGTGDTRNCSRRCQIDQLTRYVEANTCGPSLIGGDFNVNIQEFADDEGCEGRNEREDLFDLFSRVDGVSTYTLAQPPTQVTGTSLNGGGTLDFHILANNENNIVEITTVTQPIFDCVESWTVTKVVPTGPSVPLFQVIYQAPTRQEAEEFVANYPYFGTLIIEQVLDCSDNEFEADELSDHLPIKLSLIHISEPTRPY